MAVFQLLSKLSKIVYGLLTLTLLSIATLLIFSGSVLQLPNRTQLFAIQTGSMEPAIPTGSVIVTQPQAEYKVSDVVTFSTDNSQSIITHRVVEKKLINNQEELVTRGDANNTNDLQTRKKDQVIGKVLFHVPFLGYVLTFAKTQMGFLLLIVLPTVIIVSLEISQLKGEAKKMFDQFQAKKITGKDKKEVDLHD